MVDYTVPTFEPLMEYESTGLTYRYVYGNSRLSVVVSGLTCTDNEDDDNDDDDDDHDDDDHDNIIENGTMPLYYHMNRLGSAILLTSGITGSTTFASTVLCSIYLPWSSNA